MRCVPAAAAVQSAAAATAVLGLPNVKMAPGGQEHRFKGNTHLKLMSSVDSTMVFAYVVNYNSASSKPWSARC